jgi:hypothetical protein
MGGKTIAAWEVEVKQMIAANMQEDAFHLAAPLEGGLIRCNIKRVKSFFGGCSFRLYLESNQTFLMAARKRKKSKTSSYVLSQDSEDLHRDTENCLAKV